MNDKEILFNRLTPKRFTTDRRSLSGHPIIVNNVITMQSFYKIENSSRRTDLAILATLNK